MGRAPALLSRARFAAFAALAIAVVVYYETHASWPRFSVWPDVTFLAFLILPAVFGLVVLLLPLWPRRWIGYAGAGLAVLAVLCDWADFAVAGNFAKLFATTFVGWWFLGIFEELSWVVLVSLLVPWVDAYSVWRGPTKTITEKHVGVFHHLSIYFPDPGRHVSSHLGLPDVLFFAVFLAAAARFRLRVGWTWLAMTLSFGATVALAVWRDLNG
ncbi:MAG: hypothetical protein QOE36_1025, partial [Gaiellaceae bacterium]|nr:hypothetical protein [Gaiellaceae bacterium]